MLAARIAAPHAPFTLEDLPLPVPGLGEVLIRVAACGICGSDLHLADGQELPPGVCFPLTPGHEIAGEVEDVGAGVHDVAPGARVAVHPNLPCGWCAACRRGADNLCLAPQVMGYHRLGGYCEYTTAPAHALLRCASATPAWEHIAIVPDAVSTPYHALTTRGALRAGEQVVVYGLGGLGAHAVLLAAHLGASRVVAVVRRAEAADLARAFGATDVVVAEPGKAARGVRELTGGGADLAVDVTGSAPGVAAATASVRPGGRAVAVGMSEDRLALMPAVRFARLEIALLGSYTSTLAEAQTVMDLLARGTLDLTRSVTHRYRLAEVNRAYADLRARTGNPIRAVLLP